MSKVTITTLKGIAPQFLVDDLRRSIEYYCRRLGFELDFNYESFYASVRTYFPGLPDNSLVPDYCGIRPKLTGKGEPAADFLIDGPAGHGLPRLVNLFGIESPGLTSALSIAEEVVGQLE